MATKNWEIINKLDHDLCSMVDNQIFLCVAGFYQFGKF